MKPEMYDNSTVRSTLNGEDDDPWIFATVRPSSANSTHLSERMEIGTVKRLASPPSVLTPSYVTNCFRRSDELMLIIQMIKIVLFDHGMYQKIQ